MLPALHVGPPGEGLGPGSRLAFPAEPGTTSGPSRLGPPESGLPLVASFGLVLCSGVPTVGSHTPSGCSSPG